MIAGLDHLVLTVRDLEASVHFYQGVFGMELRRFGEGRLALHFGGQKINLHEAGREFEPKAAQPTPGSADLCLLTALPLAEVEGRLRRHGVPLLEGPVARYRRHRAARLRLRPRPRRQSRGDCDPYVTHPPGELRHRARLDARDQAAG